MRGVGSEEDGESGEEEESEHGGDEDPVREEASYDAGKRWSAARSSAPADCNRHWIRNQIYNYQH